MIRLNFLFERFAIISLVCWPLTKRLQVVSPYILIRRLKTLQVSA